MNQDYNQLGDQVVGITAVIGWIAVIALVLIEQTI